MRIGSNPQPGFEVVSITAEPAQLSITGPESRVRSVDAVQTDPVDLAEVTGEDEFRVESYISEPQVRLADSARVKVKVKVRQKGGTDN